MDNCETRQVYRGNRTADTAARTEKGEDKPKPQDQEGVILIPPPLLLN